LNRIVADGQSVELKVERPLNAPAPVLSKTHPWYRGHVLALNHPYFAVTGDDGRFRITGLPVGEWKFAIWQESRGFLPQNEFPTGRFTLKVKAGDNDLGDLVCDPPPQLRRQNVPILVGRDVKALFTDQGNVLSDLHRASMVGDVQRAKDLLRIGMNVNDRESRLDGTPLHYAARHGHAEIVRALIEKGATVDARDIHSRTPLMWAGRGGHADAVRALLDANANIDAIDHRGWTTLHFAADRGDDDLSQLLLDRGADRNIKTRDGRAPFDLKPSHEVSAKP
jgi:ankyrin repeat protein